MYRNIIFDFDGVIINSHDIQSKALRESYRAIGGEGEPPYALFFQHSGDSLENIFKNLNLPLDMIPIYRKISYDNIDMVKIYPGILELLYELNDNKYICSICTGKDRKRTREILRYFNIEHLFKTIVCSDDVVHPKPHPESLLFIMEQLNALPEETTLIGDGINDILAAQKAGINSVAVTWGELDERELEKHNPNQICSSVVQLRNILLGDITDK